MSNVYSVGSEAVSINIYMYVPTYYVERRHNFHAFTGMYHYLSLFLLFCLLPHNTQFHPTTNEETTHHINRAKMKFSAAFFLCALTTASASVISLTPDNFDSATAGKTVFIKFFAPWVSP